MDSDWSVTIHYDVFRCVKHKFLVLGVLGAEAAPGPPAADRPQWPELNPCLGLSSATPKPLSLRGRFKHKFGFKWKC